MTTRTPQGGFMPVRANNLGRLLDDLTVRDMAYSDIQQFLELGSTATNEYVSILRRAGMLDMVRRNAARREVYRLTKDAASVKAFRDQINACQKKPGKSSTDHVYVAATIDLMGRIERYITKNPSTLAEPIFSAMGIENARGNKMLAYMRRDGVVRHVEDTRPTQWMIGADPALGLSVNDARVASRKSVTQWAPMFARDPLVAALHGTPTHDAEPLTHEVEPRPVALTGFAALAQVRFEMAQEQRA